MCDIKATRACIAIAVICHTCAVYLVGHFTVHCEEFSIFKRAT